MANNGRECVHRLRSNSQIPLERGDLTYTDKPDNNCKIGANEKHPCVAIALFFCYNDKYNRENYKSCYSRMAH